MRATRLASKKLVAEYSVVNLDLPEAVALMKDFIAAHPALWNEDIGV